MFDQTGQYAQQTALFPSTLAARIDRLTDRSAGFFGVWPWLGSLIQHNGYPQITYTCPQSGKVVTRGVHRVLMEMRLGRRLENHEHVLHDRGCPKNDVNPAHLRIGSRQENLDDAKADGRLRGNLDVKTVRQIDTMFHVKRMAIVEISRHTDISPTSIQRIVSGKTHSKTTGRVYEPASAEKADEIATSQGGAVI